MHSLKYGKFVENGTMQLMACSGIPRRSRTHAAPKLQQLCLWTTALNKNKQNSFKYDSSI